MRMLAMVLMLATGPDDEVNGAVKDVAGAELASLVELYTWFHSNAELSLKEEKTSAKFASEVRGAGWTVTEVEQIGTEGRPNGCVRTWSARG